VSPCLSQSPIHCCKRNHYHHIVFEGKAPHEGKAHCCLYCQSFTFTILMRLLKLLPVTSENSSHRENLSLSEPHTPMEHIFTIPISKPGYSFVIFQCHSRMHVNIIYITTSGTLTFHKNGLTFCDK
jgi:hypothetical protein